MAVEELGVKPDIHSPYYPFYKVVSGNTMAGAEELPYILTKYLMDLPEPGYTPPEDNRYPRARLKKLMYWDGALPLEQPLPTTEQMKSIQFDASHPGSEPDPERGYRIFSQELVRQAQTGAQTVLRIYLGNLDRVSTGHGFVFRQTVIYTIMCNYALEGNMKTTAASRAYQIAQAILEATEGVNFGGVGGMMTLRMTKFDDERVNTGYKIYQQVDWAAGTPNPNYGG